MSVLILHPLAAKDVIVIMPNEIKLTGKAAGHRLIVEKPHHNHFVGQVTNGIAFSSSDTNVAQIEGNKVVPVKDGTATIRAKAGGRTATARVTVEGMEKPFDWSFRNHVQPVLARNGCSAGACHGAAAGQNGFRLSLRGYDDQSDWIALTRDAAGRRIVPSDPARSLMLLKPTGAVPHKGGKKFDTNTLDYRVLVEWIAAGSPGPKAEDPHVVRIETLPQRVVLGPGETQQLTVRAHFSDGHIEDVTHWAKYTSANETVSQVDEAGNVKVVGFGEGAVTAWYLSRIDIATVTVPYTNIIARKALTRAKRRNFIDELVLEKLRSLNLPPSPRCEDTEFIRRAFLDTIGVLPTPDEVRAFIADGSPTQSPLPFGRGQGQGEGLVSTDHSNVNKGEPQVSPSPRPSPPPRGRGSHFVALARDSANPSTGKRDKLIDTLLRRPEFVDYWSYKWSDLLLVSSKTLKTPAMWSYYNWIRKNVAANTPWDSFVRGIVLAQGSTLENGAGNFYTLHDDPRLMAETTTQAFLGMSINCAKCHNHPMEKWTNNQYYQMANLFARVRAKNGAATGETIIFVANAGDLEQPLTGKPQPPAPLDGAALPMDSPEDRRVPLANWLVSRDNPYFSRSIANRIWANFMGVGLVEAVDDMRVTNPASNEKLLSALAKYLDEQKFDLKALMRVILQSETYQRSSAPLPENAADTRFYSHCYPRRLMAEVLHDAIGQVTSVPTQFTVDRRNANAGLGEKYPLGFRALQLPDTQTDSYFLKTFGRPDREKTCECERTANPNVTQMLHIANGETINKKLAAKDNWISRLLAENTPNEKIVETAYLGALSRLPTEEEKGKIVELLDQADPSDRRAAVEDMYWAILSSKEFLFNH
jgi:hypothetical protein